MRTLALDSRISKTPAGCWEWQGSRDAFGYGMKRVPGLGVRRVHRLMYEQCVGPIPTGMVVMHRCDNAPCCNPDHLSIGTRAQNNADRDSKGRWRPPGPRLDAKLTRESAEQIRAWRSYGFPARAIAQWFGVCQSHVYRVATRKAWV